jgi:hypothetical protein
MSGRKSGKTREKPMTEFKIEKGVPVPSRRSGVSGAMYQLEVGESFFVLCENRVRKQNTISTIGRDLAMKSGKPLKFTVRQVDGGVRIWRTA